MRASVRLAMASETARATPARFTSGVFCLLAIGEPRDWAAAEAIELQKLEDHHIFPRNYLTRRGFDANRDKAAINSIVNRTLISDATNKLISDTAPAH
jgi:hypothetical protein